MTTGLDFFTVMVEAVDRDDDEFVITKNGAAVAVVINPVKLQKMRDVLDVLR